MPHIFVQPTALLRLIWTVVAYTSKLTLLKSIASSAKSFIHAMVTSGWSFMYISHNIGPYTITCGIPLGNFAEKELFPLIITLCDLSFKNPLSS